jgi:hypothetical protein
VEFATWLASLSRDPDMNGSVRLPQYICRVSTAAELCEAVFPRAELRGTIDQHKARSDFGIRHAYETDDMEAHYSGHQKREGMVVACRR